MSAWMNALGAMMQTGGALGMKRAGELQDAETKRLADEAKEARDRLKKQDEAPSHFVTKRTGPGGATIEETNEQRWNPETQSYESRVISSYDLPERQKRAETELELGQRDPEALKALMEIKRGPQKVSGSNAAKEEKDPKISSLSDSEIKAMFGVADAEGDIEIDQDAYRSFLADKALKAKTDPRYNDAKFAAQEWQGKLGFNPNERPPGTFEADEPYMKLPNEKNSAGSEQKSPKPGTPEFGAKLEQLSTPETAPAAPANAGTKPAQPSSAPPQVGEVRAGDDGEFKFLGGDYKDPKNWKKIR